MTYYPATNVNFLRARQSRVGSGTSVRLDGVPQIPDDVHQTITEHGDFKLTHGQTRRASIAIREACAEIKRRLLEQAKANPVLDLEGDSE